MKRLQTVDELIAANPIIQRTRALLNQKRCQSDSIGAAALIKLASELESLWHRTVTQCLWEDHWRKFRLHSLEAYDVFEIKTFINHHFEQRNTRIEIKPDQQLVAVSVDMGSYQLEKLVSVVPMPSKKLKPSHPLTETNPEV